MDKSKKLTRKQMIEMAIKKKGKDMVGKMSEKVMAMQKRASKK